MSSPLTEQHIRALIAPHLQAGEEVLVTGHGIEQPWWTQILQLGTLFWRDFVVVGTTQRVMLIQMTRVWQEKSFESFEWPALERVEVRRGWLQRPLLLEAPAQKWRRKIQLPRFSPLHGNLDAADGILAAWQKYRAPAALAPARQAL